ncbi:MAG: hypothetical protein RLY31_464 [Bacteroidota bacterium]|jgi:hypothetical protein
MFGFTEFYVICTRTNIHRMITEQTIDQVLERMENQSLDLEKMALDFAERQPALYAMLTLDNEGALTDDESDFAVYLALVIHEAVRHQGSLPPMVPGEEIAAAEDANWQMLDGTDAGKPFEDRLDAFFDDYPEEDLLAFVEDALSAEVDDEDGTPMNLTEEGLEPMFVMLKTTIDVLTRPR